jgi:hypothetical protein
MEAWVNRGTRDAKVESVTLKAFEALSRTPEFFRLYLSRRPT